MWRGSVADMGRNCSDPELTQHQSLFQKSEIAAGKSRYSSADADAFSELDSVDMAADRIARQH